MPSLNIGTLNIQSGVQTTKGYWQYPTTIWKYILPHAQSKFLGNLADFIDLRQIDIMTFAEIDGGSFRTRQINQLKTLARTTNLNHFQFFQTSTMLGSNQGNGILSRYPLSEQYHHRLAGTGEPRYLSGVKLNIRGGDLTFFTTHLSLRKTNRIKQIEHIIEIINNTSGPIILAGDFNTEHREELALLNDTRLSHLQIQPTYPSWRPIKRLDHLFYSNELMLNHAPLLEPKHKIISDHLPILATLRM